MLFRTQGSWGFVVGVISISLNGILRGVFPEGDVGWIDAVVVRWLMGFWD